MDTADGAELTLTARFAVTLPQELVATTVTLPETAVADQDVAIVLLPCPVEIVTPAGTVHVYV